MDFLRRIFHPLRDEKTDNVYSPLGEASDDGDNIQRNDIDRIQLYQRIKTLMHICILLLIVLLIFIIFHTIHSLFPSSFRSQYVYTRVGFENVLQAPEGEYCLFLLGKINRYVYFIFNAHLLRRRSSTHYHGVPGRSDDR